MTEIAKAPAGANAPYKILKQGGKWTVVNNIGEIKVSYPGTKDGYDKALAYQAALYRNIPGAAKRATKVAWTGTAKQRIKSQESGVLEQAKGPSATAKDKNPAGGLSAAGRKKFGVKKGVVAYSSAGEEDKKRWVRWALRFTKTPRPLTDDKGQPTRYALMFHAWGEPVPKSADAVRAVHAKAVARAKQLGMGQYEKAHADAIFFEHDWEPVDGQPREVSTCSICGLNRWTAEHAAMDLVQAPAPALDRRAQIKKNLQLPEGMSRHNYLGNADNRCLTCDQIQEHPVHGVDGDPELTKQLLLDHDSLVPGETRQVLAADVDDAAAASTPAESEPEPGLVDEVTPDFVTVNTGDTQTTTLDGHPVLIVRDRVPEPERLEQLPETRAFFTEVGERTLLTAPASTFTPSWEKALTPNEHMLWMQGRFVGAEKANRNGAFWSTADLAMGEPTVKHGPLNWLHEAKHVIGTIADAKLILPTEETAADGQFNEPHIVAMAAVWKWIYQDEAYVMEQASDQGKLWYSMECISKEIACTGDTGCGQSYPYMNVMKADASVCDHIKGRTSTRRLVDPTFLGGAVIVPPVRPGWADADAQVLRQAAAEAEKSYEQANPNLTASEWEALMAQVVGWGSR